MHGHNHIEVLGSSMDCVWNGWVGGRRNHVWLGDDLEQVVWTAACPFGMVGVDCAAGNCCEGIAQFRRLVQAIGVHGNGDIHLLGYRKTAIDDIGECPQVFMNFQAARASLDALHQALWSAAATTRQETYIDGDILKCLEHAL